MDYDLVPFEATSQVDLRPSALYLINRLAVELQDHGMALFINQTLIPGIENFRVASFGKNDVLGDWVIAFKKLSELDENYGYIIREYGQRENDKTFIEDKFLPFSSVLQLRDEKFKKLLDEEIEIISALRISELETLMSVAIENAICDNMMHIMYEEAVELYFNGALSYGKIAEAKRPLVNLIYTRLFKLKRSDTREVLIKALPRFVV